MKKLSFYKKEIISLLLIALLAIIFWSGSRYPQLNEKQSMGDRISISSALNFEEILPYKKSEILPIRVLKSTANWLYTNWKGMTFGFLLAACFLTLFQSLREKISFKNIYLQALIGIFIGAPLGVCVNCATPIGKGMISSGQRLITSLTTMQASPSLNIVVLGMMFTLFPLDFGLFKILFTILFLLFILPTLIYLVNGKEDLPLNQIHNSISWKEAFSGTFPLLFKNLLFILKATLPFMILSGFLGSLLVEVFPLEGLVSLPFNLKNLTLLAIIGTLLPVPIAFDLVITFLLMNLGLPIGLCFTLFFTLGIFSIYPMIVIWRDISFKIALSIFLAVVTTGILGGLAFNGFNSLLMVKTEKLLKNFKNHRKIYSVIVDACKKYDPFNTHGCINKHVEEEARLGVGEKICDNLKSPETKETCRFVGVLKRAEENQDPRICHELKALRKKCLSEYQDSIPIFKKMTSNFCKDIKDRNKRFLCLSGLKTDIENAQNKNWCNYLENDSLIQSCVFNQVLNVIKRGGDKKICQTLPHPELIKSCHKEVAFQQTIKNIKQTGKDLCGQIGYGEHYLKCKKLIIDWKASQGERFCKTHKNSELKNYCLNRYYSLKAEKTGDLSFCEKTTNQSLCQSETFYKIKERLKKCDGLPEFFKYLCVTELKDKKVRNAIFNLKADYLKSTSLNTYHSPSKVIIRALPTPKIAKTLIYTDPAYKVYKIPFNQKSPVILKKFSYLEGEEIGLNYPLSFRPYTRFEPFAHSLGISSGDFNNDLLPDILVPMGSEINLYQNLGATFKRFVLPTKGIEPVILVALVDINEDGFQDIFFGKWKAGSGFFINKKGSFNTDDFIEIPNTKGKIPMAASFGDLDGLGPLDFYLGNWSFGTKAAAKAPFKSSLNQLFINLAERELPGNVGGETLSVLISDINGDNRPDILEANDFGVPDKYFLNSESGFVEKENFPPIAPANSMSIDTADVNGDLKLDIFSVDLDFAHEIPLRTGSYCDPIQNVLVKKNCEKNLKLRKIVARRDPKKCDSRACLVQILVELAMDFKEESYCEKIPDDYSHLKSICLDQFRVSKQKYTDLKTLMHPQVTSNILLLGGKTLTDVSTSMEIRNSGWSWNAKFGDLNNDGWPDLYVANGYLIKNMVTSNVFYKNLKGKKFARLEKQYGLDDLLHTSSFTYVDFDSDGDLDIISTGINAPIRIFRNETKNNSVQFIFQNKRNIFGLGYKVTIFGKNFKRVKEIKLGGGYQSFDLPMAHFGLGGLKKIDRIEVSRPFRRDLFIKGPFHSGNKYLISIN